MLNMQGSHASWGNRWTEVMGHSEAPEASSVTREGGKGAM